MKLGKKGFMLAEVVVVALTITVILVTAFTGLNRVSKVYDKRNKYYDINAEYFAIEANNILIRNGNINTLISNNSSVEVTSNVSDIISAYPSTNYTRIKVYFSPYNQSKIDTLSNINGVNQTFKDYVTYINGHFDYEEDYTYVIIAEMCRTQDDCNYYGLKVR